MAEAVRILETVATDNPTDLPADAASSVAYADNAQRPEGIEAPDESTQTHEFHVISDLDERSAEHPVSR